MRPDFIDIIIQQVELDRINQEIDAMTDEEIAAELEAEGFTQAKIDATFARITQALKGASHVRK